MATFCGRHNSAPVIYVRLDGPSNEVHYQSCECVFILRSSGTELIQTAPLCCLSEGTFSPSILSPVCIMQDTVRESNLFFSSCVWAEERALRVSVPSLFSKNSHRIIKLRDYRTFPSKSVTEIHKLNSSECQTQIN